MRATRTKSKPKRPQVEGTPTGTALLVQCLEAPEDDAPRLVYADWLEQQGHPFADVIRAQLAGKPAKALIERHHASWIGPIESWVVDPVFERGMLRRIYGKAGGYVQRATQALLLGPASTFGVAETMLRGPCKKLGTAATLGFTSSLFWWDCQLDDALLGELVTSPHAVRLSSLTLEKVRATDRGLATLARAPLSRLRHLGLPAPVHLGRFTATGILAVLEHLPVTSLALTGVNTLDLAPLVGSPRTARLEHLSVDTRHVRAVASSPHLTALQTLRISTIDHVEDTDVAPLLDNPALRALREVVLKCWSPQASTRKPSAEMVARLQARFGGGFRYETSGR